MPDHGVVEGVVLPSQLCVCGLVSCVQGGDVRGGHIREIRCRRIVDQAEIHMKITSDECRG